MTNLPPLQPVPQDVLRAKRILDVVLGFILVFIIAPVFWMIWLGYRLGGILIPADRGPALHKIFRYVDGRMVLLYKFRVSVASRLKESEGALPREEMDKIKGVLSARDYETVVRCPNLMVEDSSSHPTRLGWLIKQAYLDELPQFFNILQGRMSLVGPRPMPLNSIRVVTDENGLVTIGDNKYDYRHRNMAPSGLTGLYQLNKSERAKRDYIRFIQEGVAKDWEYYQALLTLSPLRIVLLDIKIIIKTLGIVFEAEGI